MKRLVLGALLTLPVWGPLSALAQRTDAEAIAKGTFWLGSSTALRIRSNDDQRLVDLFARTRVGYLFADNWGVAISVVYQNVDDQTATQEGESRRLVLNANIRRYLPWSHKLAFYGLIGYNYDLTTFENRTPTTGDRFDGAFIRHQLGFSLGLLYFVTRRFAIESQFGTILLAAENTPYDGAGYRFVAFANVQPERAAQNFSFFSLNYYFRR